MDKIEIDELTERLENKTVLAAGDIYEMFGVKYLTAANVPDMDDPCDVCAFSECACMFNADIPSCYNNVHFEVIKGIEFALCDSFGEIIDMVKYIDTKTVRTADGTTYDIQNLFREDYTIEPMIVR